MGIDVLHLRYATVYRSNTYNLIQHQATPIFIFQQVNKRVIDIFQSDVDDR